MTKTADSKEFLAIITNALTACDRTIQEATSSNKEWMIEDATNAKLQFTKLATRIQENKLPPSQGGGLGITRALSEWAPDYLYSAGDAVERFYMKNWR